MKFKFVSLSSQIDFLSDSLSLFSKRDVSQVYKQPGYLSIEIRRAWDTYTGVENVVKNMIMSLRAVDELQNCSYQRQTLAAADIIYWNQVYYE
ncbi:hypothetical protein EB796_023981 [Bugula neritina]|uniref:Uncharacterized protein n=1 Tax=Bugula neritina TaxID=10212 RepID=A0A7J7IUV0_BUGNE|nr:hypothetical protein EB796_023981 [Bugula neritina]